MVLGLHRFGRCSGVLRAGPVGRSAAAPPLGGRAAAVLGAGLARRLRLRSGPLGPIWVLGGPDRDLDGAVFYTWKTEGSSDGERRCQRRAFCSATAGALRASRGPAGPVGPWAWCAPVVASGRLPSLTVEVGPSRVSMVLRPSSRLFFFDVQASLHWAVERQCERLHDRGGAGWWAVWWSAPERLGIWGREKSQSACPTPARWRLRVPPVLLEGCPVFPPSLSRTGGNPRQQHRHRRIPS